MKYILGFIMIFSTYLTFGCDCDWHGALLNNIEKSDVLIQGKVVKRIYYTKYGHRFTNIKQFERIVDSLNLGYYDTIESVEIEVVELLNGNEKRKIIEIFSTNGGDCNESTKDLELNENYIFLPYHYLDSYRVPNYKIGQYALANCFESWLKIDLDKQKVQGRIDNDKKQIISLKIFKKKLKIKLSNL